MRQRAFENKNPFQYEFVPVEISFPDDEPDEGAFFTCKNSPFLGRTIQISNPDFSKKIERTSGGHSGSHCTREPIKIQLNKKDGLEIFGKPLFKDK